MEILNSGSFIPLENREKMEQLIFTARTLASEVSRSEGFQSGRSSVLFQFCPLSCKGCWVPHLHSPDGGGLVSVRTLAEKLLDPSFERDGVSILGGEPFVQPESLLALVKELRQAGCEHILCYSGYTFETLAQQAKKQPAIGAVLADIDMLIDGPYVETMTDRAGAWTGSGNQRVIDLCETRRTGRLVLYSKIS